MLLVVLSPIFFSAVIPFVSLAAADYVPLSPLPDTSNCDADGKCGNIKGNFSDYISGVYRLAIAVAGALAVIVIIWEGIQHMTSESFTKKSDTTQRIQAALAGLLLVLLAFLILKAINPDLVNFSLNLKPVLQVEKSKSLVEPEVARTLEEQSTKNANAAAEKFKSYSTQIEEMNRLAEEAFNAGDLEAYKDITIRLQGLQLTQRALFNQDSTFATAQGFIAQDNFTQAERAINSIQQNTADQLTKLRALKEAAPTQDLKNQIQTQIDQVEQNGTAKTNEIQAKLQQYAYYLPYNYTDDTRTRKGMIPLGPFTTLIECEAQKTALRPICTGNIFPCYEPLICQVGK